ncbi:MAG TPA: adenosylmethionine--8-amino-7-oxononanoate transaminase [Acidimicrobiales bacterium]|nr:adenosylmethionine--8-amino-7-oxononanoate transaminase [Acidimicrobiales bacterium]
MTSRDDRAALGELTSFDREHVWHPYASIPAALPPLVVESAQGVRLRVVSPDGSPHELVDAMSSWWAAIHGYGHPRLVEAAVAQAREMSHVMFGGLTHRPAVDLARRLVEITPGPLDRVFFADSGSVAVEVALKMALQHWRSTGRPGRKRVLTWRGGYHGDTLFAMSVCDPEGGMHALWADVVPRQVFVPAPPAGFGSPVDTGFVSEVEATVARHAHELAALVVEPVVQGAGGMRFHNPAYLRALRAVCDEHGVLLVFDEIATGFGRTGPLFACEWAGVVPDIMSVGKALTGGMMSLAATLCTAEVAEGIARGEVPVLAHGPTYMANPLACATALASVDLLLAGDHGGTVGRIEAGLRQGLASVGSTPGVAEVRVLGAIGVIQLDHPVDVAAATAAAVAEGVWIRPFGDLVYAMPPYVCSDDEVAQICRGLAAAAAAG